MLGGVTKHQKKWKCYKPRTSLLPSLLSSSSCWALLEPRSCVDLHLRWLRRSVELVLELPKIHSWWWLLPSKSHTCIASSRWRFPRHPGCSRLRSTCRWSSHGRWDGNAGASLGSRDSWAHLSMVGPLKDQIHSPWCDRCDHLTRTEHIKKYELCRTPVRWWGLFVGGVKKYMQQFATRPKGNAGTWK